MLFKISAIVVAMVASASAQMTMIEPCTRYTPNNPKCPAPPAGKTLDLNQKNPLGKSEPLCKHTTPYTTPVATWTAGQSITTRFEAGEAAHGGGHLQFSLSYDGGKTFVVIYEELKYAFLSGPTARNAATILNYTFSLPRDIPASDKAIFAWTWVNAVGSRDFYMNCADVAIKGYSNSFTGKQMTIANHDGYPTIPEFNSNNDTDAGLEHYRNAPLITVTGDGSTPSAVKPTPVEELKPTKVERVLVIASSSPAVPSPIGGGCVHGSTSCAFFVPGFYTCIWGVWSSFVPCGANTRCKYTGHGSVICGW
ncbi:hypothetical protein IWW57_000391 [Coemansia sp. S610]|nr:hypothetical protein IWW57_000391 [Coemansia sp. S610]KAJ2416967.1 hypothetical protein GGI10_000568 [Coemansia sp. RSA 2530]KAJ2694878.1 hypothetical protein H4218_005425 [Coemansia sp. IMI 209128]